MLDSIIFSLVFLSFSLFSAMVFSLCFTFVASLLFVLFHFSPLSFLDPLFIIIFALYGVLYRSTGTSTDFVGLKGSKGLLLVHVICTLNKKLINLRKVVDFYTLCTSINHIDSFLQNIIFSQEPDNQLCFSSILYMYIL